MLLVAAQFLRAEHDIFLYRQHALTGCEGMAVHWQQMESRAADKCMKLLAVWRVQPNCCTMSIVVGQILPRISKAVCFEKNCD